MLDNIVLGFQYQKHSFDMEKLMPMELKKTPNILLTWIVTMASRKQTYTQIDR